MARPIRDQVVVITGASSGIGRATALAFGRQGARVVLAARHEQRLGEVARAIEEMGGHAVVVLTDVARWDDVTRLARTAVDHFGRIDTWVNNAGVSVYGTVEQTPVEEIERVIQVDLLGPIYGVKAVLPHLTRQGYGTIITVSSVLGRRSVPLQAPYCAAKHGLVGFIEALRLELAHTAPAIRATLILPASIATPFFDQARSRMGVRPQGMPPLYPPELVADAILVAAEQPRRDMVVGDAGKLLLLAQRLSPALVDWLMLMDGLAVRQQRTSLTDDGQGNLFEPMEDGGHRLASRRPATAFSPLTRLLDLGPGRFATATALGLLGAALLTRRR